jgi:SAM-dependent methyltransferase
MRSYWDERARENAVWYVDTSLDYRQPDMDAFFATGERVVQMALLEAPVAPKGRGLAIEIGPGLGRICKALAAHFDRVVGIDISEEMVERARQLVDDPAVSFEVGNGVDLAGVESDSADFVVTFTVLQHLPEASLVESYLREAARVLKPGGVLCAQWNNLPHPLLWKLRVWWWQLRRLAGGRIAGVGGDIRGRRPFAGTRVPFKRVTATLEDAGLQVRGSQGLGTLFSFVWAEKPVSA